MGGILNPLHATLALTSLVVAASYLYYKLNYQRFKINTGLPQHPPSLLWGHLRVMDEYTKRGNPERHPDAVLSEMHRAIGSPPIMRLDIWPIRTPIVVVAHHEIAEQLVRSSKEFRYGIPKAPVAAGGIVHLVGDKSILRLQNEEWKEVRRRFNPGFAPGHLIGLLPCILDKMTPFLNRIDGLARTGEEFPFQQLMRDLTFDIMGAVVMDVDLDAQHTDVSQQGKLIRLYKEMLQTYGDDRLHLPGWLTPITELKRRRLGIQITEQLREIVRRKHQDMRTMDQADGKSRTIVALGLQDTEHLTPEILDSTCDQIKTFLFAGHDTTSTVLSWAMYELSRTPRALAAVRDELDDIFGPEIARSRSAMRDQLLSPGGEEILNRMLYISAVIKEILRLYPPAGTFRMAQPGKDTLASTSEGDSYCLNGYWIYINHTIIQRSRAVYGDSADDFVPERWLGDDIDNKYPTTSWRPFERGPRNCIGQVLANIEARIIIAMLAHQYEFVKVGLGELDRDENGNPVLNDKDQYKVKSEMHSIIEITAKPTGEMMMKVDAVASP